MNFLAHARHHLDRPYAVAGSALPDWTRFLSRRSRIRKKTLPAVVEHDDTEHGDVLRGVWAHVHDDIWFHAQPEFESGVDEIGALIRNAYAPARVRGSFLAHILLEMLLDAALQARAPRMTSRYYEALSAVDPTSFATAARAIVVDLETEDAHFVALFQRFISERFLEDYQDDHTLAVRLSQVATRVGLDALDGKFLAIVPACRAIVDERADALLLGPSAG